MTQTTTLSNGRGWLDIYAAASVARLDKQIGHPLQITEAGRTYEQQKAHWDRYVEYLNGGPWAPLAARPGTSPHEFGKAIDTNEGQRIVSAMVSHGWRRPLPSEPWHFVYNYDLDNHRHEGSGSGSGSTPTPTPKPEEGFLMALANQQQAQVYDSLIEHGPVGDYYKTDAILIDLRKYGEGLVARIDAANTRLEQLLLKVEALEAKG